MKLLNGKEVKEKVLADLKEKLGKINRQLGLVVIQIGDDAASSVYVKQKQKMAMELGYNFQHLKFDSNISQADLLNEISKLNNDDLVDGILIQMPIPKHLDSKIVQNAICYYKDVDGLTDINIGRLVHNVDSLVPCTPKGIMRMLEYYNIDVVGKHVVIVGKSDLVGKPLANLMINKNATVTLCHSMTKDLNKITKKADILVIAIGKEKFIGRDFVKKGAVVIDVGINRKADGSLCGDVDFDDVKDIVSYITPVPCGVGPMTVALLGENTYKAYRLRCDDKNL